MIDTQAFGHQLLSLGYKFTGVPCSYLKNIQNFAIKNNSYLVANNEADAVAIAAGAHIANKKMAILMQNSGLMNSMSPWTSLIDTFKIPILAFVSLRDGESQHELTGQITKPIIDLLNIFTIELDIDNAIAKSQLSYANSLIDNGQSVIFIIRKGIFSEINLDFNQAPTYSSRKDALSIINRYKKDSVLLATTGHTGRELYGIEDSVQNLYMVGSMGSLGALSLGIAINKPYQKVVAIDGDGSILMRPSIISTIGHSKVKNLLHIVLDNNLYASTGNQSTISEDINFYEFFLSQGYQKVICASDIDDFEYEYKEWVDKDIDKGCLTMIYLKISISDTPKNRPKITPPEVKERLKKYINGTKNIT